MSNLPEPLWHDEEDMSSSPLWISSSSMHLDNSDLDEDPLLIAKCSDANFNCIHDEEVAAMLAAEWGQSSASSAAFIARPPPTWKEKLTGVIVGVIIFGILCSAGAYVATLEKTENKHGAQNIRSCSDMGMMMEQWSPTPSMLCNDLEPNCACQDPTRGTADEKIKKELNRTQNQRIGRTPVDVVFMGIPFNAIDDILTQVNGTSIGIEEERISTLLYRLENGFLPTTLRPRVWWITVGINELLQDSCSMETVYVGWVNLIESLLQAQNGPSPKVVISGFDANNAAFQSSTMSRRNVELLNQRLECSIPTTFQNRSVHFFDATMRDDDDDDDFFGDVQYSASSTASLTLTNPRDQILGVLSELLQL